MQMSASVVALGSYHCKLAIEIFIYAANLEANNLLMLLYAQVIYGDFATIVGSPLSLKRFQDLIVAFIKFYFVCILLYQ